MTERIDVAQVLLKRMQEREITRLVCGWVDCTAAASLNLPAISRLVRHVTEDHTRHVSILAEKWETFAPAFALAASLGLPPDSELEKRWREDPRERHADILQRMVNETYRHNQVLTELSRELDELADEQRPPKVERCPKCGHAPHRGGFCLNMASDNDCDCGEDTRA